MFILGLIDLPLYHHYFNLRRLFTYLLLVLFVFQLCGRIGYVAWFKLNQEAITELFCVNKFKPQMQCKGKCFLMREMKQQDERQQHNPEWNKTATEDFFIAEEALHAVPFFNFNQEVLPNNKGMTWNKGFARDVFQPPTC